jgi:23S rRNA pseudouridine955/2504/2580 synthase
MKEIKISHPSDAWQRLDKFVKKYLPNAPLGGIYKMLRTGKIKVNGKKKDQTYKIEQDDVINFWLADEEMENLLTPNPSPKGEGNSQNPPSLKEKGLGDEVILYEDEYLLVVNKPAGMNVHPGDHKTKEASLIELVHDYLGGKYDSLTFRPALIHRIDRDTSGCIMIAKTKETLEFLLEELQSHKIEKIYHALVSGVPEKPSWTIRAKILRLENANHEAKVRVDENGQNAVTHYKLMQNSKFRIQNSGSQKSWINNLESWISCSLLECRIETGRTHQIRVHLSFINCPILGDKAYGNASINSFIRRNSGISRQMLHAFRLSFIHPKTKKNLTVGAPYPEDFRKLLSEKAG